MKYFVQASVVLSLLVINGCVSQKNAETDSAGKSAKSAEVSTEPVTLTMAVVGTSLSDESFQTNFVQNMKKKLPNITLQMTTGKIEDLVTAGNAPDIVYSSSPGLRTLQDLNLIESLDPFIKKFGTDLSKYDPVLMDFLKRFSNKGEILGLPYKMNIPVLFYNKDIFNKFGLPNPKDGMTWDETIQLSRTLTRVDGGTQYLGLYTGGADRMAMGLNLSYVDKTNQAQLETESWKRVLTTYVSAHSIPGYVVDGKMPDLWSLFLKEKQVAMAAFWGPDGIGALDELNKSGKGMNWDMVTLPTFDKGSGFAWQLDSHNLIVTSTSKHKEQAYLVASVMTGEELQNQFNKNGVLTGLNKTDEIIKQFGSTLTIFEGKNKNALFALKPGVRDITKFDTQGRNIINQAANEMLYKGSDANSALRIAQEKLNQYISQQSTK